MNNVSTHDYTIPQSPNYEESDEHECCLCTRDAGNEIDGEWYCNLHYLEITND